MAITATADGDPLAITCTHTVRRFIHYILYVVYRYTTRSFFFSDHLFFFSFNCPRARTHTHTHTDTHTLMRRGQNWFSWECRRRRHRGLWGVGHRQTGFRVRPAAGTNRYCHREHMVIIPIVFSSFGPACVITECLFSG